MLRLRHVVLGLLLCLALLADAVSAGCNLQPTPLIPGAPNSKKTNYPPHELEERVGFYAKARAETADPFLSATSGATSANKYQSTAAPAGIQRSVGRAQGQTATGTVFALDTPLPQDYYLNLRKPVTGTIYVSSALWQAGARDSVTVRVELFVGDLRLGGDEATFDAATAWSSWAFHNLCFRPELPLLPKGEVLKLRVSQLAGLSDLWVGTSGKEQTYVEFAYFPFDPMSSTMYLEDGVLLSGPPSEGGGGEATRRPVSFLALAPVLGLLALGRRRGGATLAVLALALSGLAGCLSSDRGSPEGSTEGDDPTPSVESTFESRPDLEAAGRGAIEGLLRDENQLPVVGANVAVLGTNLFTRSSPQGRFAFDNLTAGTYRMRIDATDYPSLEQAVVVEIGKLTRLNITLVRPTSPGPGGAKPHLHDDWLGETRVVVDEVDVTYTADRPGGFFCWGPGLNLYTSQCDTPIPLTDGARVLPGSTQIEIQATWPSALGLKEFGLRVETATNDSEDQRLVPRGPNDPYRLAFFPDEADPGHQPYTSWKLFLRPTWPRSHFHFVGPVNDYSFSVHVKIFAIKGVVPLEPSHRAFWLGRDQVPLLNHAENKNGCVTCDYPRADTDVTNWRPGQNLVPPGTKEIRGYLTWFNPQNAPAGTDWVLLYRPATVPPGAGLSEWRKATMSGASPNKTFLITLEAGEADQFYQKRSNWVFGLDDQLPATPIIAYSPNTNYNSRFFLTATAHKDPAYTEETPDG